MEADAKTMDYLAAWAEEGMNAPEDAKDYRERAARLRARAAVVREVHAKYGLSFGSFPNAVESICGDLPPTPPKEPA